MAERVKIDAKCVFTKDYEEKADRSHKKTNPIQTQSSFLLSYSGSDFVNQTDKAADDIWWIEVIIDSY